MTTKEFIIQTLRSRKANFSRFGIRSIGLFGSYARNEPTSGSDIDILVDFDPSFENFENLMSVCAYLEQIFINEKVEIVTKNGLSPYIGPRILNEVVYV
ncbi:DNA polymerase subunit beta [bacterium]|nr:DNA polymerase subunit beta [bacterium]